MSKATLGRAGTVEVCLAISRLPETFTHEELMAALRETWAAADVEPLSQSAVRQDTTRLRDDFGVLERIPRARGERTRVEHRRHSALWSLCSEMYERLAKTHS